MTEQKQPQKQLVMEVVHYSGEESRKLNLEVDKVLTQDFNKDKLKITDYKTYITRHKYTLNNDYVQAKYEQKKCILESLFYNISDPFLNTSATYRLWKQLYSSEIEVPEYVRGFGGYRETLLNIIEQYTDFKSISDSTKVTMPVVVTGYNKEAFSALSKDNITYDLTVSEIKEYFKLVSSRQRYQYALKETNLLGVRQTYNTMAIQPEFFLENKGCLVVNFKIATSRGLKGKALKNQYTLYINTLVSDMDGLVYSLGEYNNLYLEYTLVFPKYTKDKVLEYLQSDSIKEVYDDYFKLSRKEKEVVENLTAVGVRQHIYEVMDEPTVTNKYSLEDRRWYTNFKLVATN